MQVSSFPATGWCGAVVFGSYTKTTGRTRAVVTVVVVMVVVATGAVERPAVAGRSGWRGRQQGPWRTENTAHGPAVKCCTAKTTAAIIG